MLNNIVNPQFLLSLSEISLQKLERLPNWIVQNYPKLINQPLKIMESGQTTLTVLVGQKIIVKIFVPKYKNQKNSKEVYKQRLVQNYIDLAESEISLESLGIIFFSEHDEILETAVVVNKYFAESRPLVDFFYEMNTEDQTKRISKVIDKLKEFHQPILNFDYSTKRILDEFDRTIAKDGKYLPEYMKMRFQEIRKNTAEKLISNEIFLIHCDVHLENILIDNNLNLNFIDFDYSHFAPRFRELLAIFLFTFLPKAVVPEKLKQHYLKPMLNIFEHFLKEYPQLWDDNYKNEIKLLFAIQLTSKSEFTEFEELVKEAFEYFFLD